VFGTFEIADGKIARWREYFDPGRLPGVLATVRPWQAPGG
jgi:limonene-1,2-epoxide hydrolase